MKSCGFKDKQGMIRAGWEKAWETGEQAVNRAAWKKEMPVSLRALRVGEAGRAVRRQGTARTGRGVGGLGRGGAPGRSQFKVGGMEGQSVTLGGVRARAGERLAGKVGHVHGG